MKMTYQRNLEARPEQASHAAPGCAGTSLFARLERPKLPVPGAQTDLRELADREADAEANQAGSVNLVFSYLLNF